MLRQIHAEPTTQLEPSCFSPRDPGVASGVVEGEECARHPSLSLYGRAVKKGCAEQAFAERGKRNIGGRLRVCCLWVVRRLRGRADGFNRYDVDASYPLIPSLNELTGELKGVRLNGSLSMAVSEALPRCRDLAFEQRRSPGPVLGGTLNEEEGDRVDIVVDDRPKPKTPDGKLEEGC